MEEQRNISSNRTKSFLFRISESELASLQEEAGRQNMNVSQYIRYNLFGNGTHNKNVASDGKIDKTVSQKMLASCRDSVKKSCTEIEKYIHLYSDSVAFTDGKGNPKISEGYTTRITKSIVHNLENVVDSFNGVAVLLGGNTIEKGSVGALAGASVQGGLLLEGFSLIDVRNNPQAYLKFMWKSSLVGDVVDVFPEKEIRPGVKTISFILLVEEYLDGKKCKYQFVIEANKLTFMMASVSKGAHLTVFGTTAVRKNDSGKFELYMFADNIVE